MARIKLSSEQLKINRAESQRKYRATKKYQQTSSGREKIRTNKRRQDPEWVEKNRLYAASHRSNLTKEEKLKEAAYNKFMHSKTSYRAKNWKKAGIINIPLAMEIWESSEVCNICGNTTARMHLDHDHNTSLPRGKLCSKCNHALGLVGDNIEILNRMIDYLGGATWQGIG